MGIVPETNKNPRTSEIARELSDRIGSNVTVLGPTNPRHLSGIRIYVICHGGERLVVRDYRRDVDLYEKSVVLDGDCNGKHNEIMEILMQYL